MEEIKKRCFLWYFFREFDDDDRRCSRPSELIAWTEVGKSVTRHVEQGRQQAGLLQATVRRQFEEIQRQVDAAGRFYLDEPAQQLVRVHVPDETETATQSDAGPARQDPDVEQREQQWAEKSDDADWRRLRSSEEASSTDEWRTASQEESETSQTHQDVDWSRRHQGIDQDAYYTFPRNTVEQEVKVIWQKAPHGGPIPRLGVTPGGRKLYHWIPGVGFPISVP